VRGTRPKPCLHLSDGLPVGLLDDVVKGMPCPGVHGLRTLVRTRASGSAGEAAGVGRATLGGGQQRLHLCREQGPPSFSQKCAEQASPAPEGARGGSLVRCGQPRPSSLLGGAGRPYTACVFDRELYHPLHHVGAQVLVELPLEGLELDVVGVLAEGVGELCADVVDTWSSK